ncbi:MAG: response regulator [Bacteroidota bacterium]|nr:response regulator [Bacteroidota bacterium]
MSKILVVDDDLDILSVVEMLLTMKGFTVEVASHGDHVISKAQSFQPDLVLLDVLISGFDGRNICRQLKSGKQTSHIPVIMFSAHPGAANSITDYGADDFIAKPFDVSMLLKKVNSQLESYKNIA